MHAGLKCILFNDEKTMTYEWNKYKKILDCGWFCG